MYSTCTFCNHSLGSNEVIEHFPVGRRLAFDESKGRLWVICRSCSGWNLTPLEERWEAIEEAERLYRETRLRVSTDNIGLARARDGTDLVRVGKPQRPELAAWRYGEQLVKRRRKHIVAAGLVVGSGAAIALGGAFAGAGMIGVFTALRIAERWASHGFPESTIGRVHDDRGRLIKVKRRDLLKTTIGADGDGGLLLRVDTIERLFFLRGQEARRAATVLFRAVNRRGGDHDEIASAAGRLARAGSAEQFLSDTARRGKKLSRVITEDSLEFMESKEALYDSGLLALSTSLSLAIEMALHEDQERKVLEGELAELENAWREAEEIGSIADSLLLPAGLDRVLARLRVR